MAGQRQQHPRTASASTSAWEDDAWKIDSDDEDFVKASRRSGAGTSSSTAIARLNMLADSDRSGGSASNTNNLSASTAVPSSGTPLRRAPPARPHPYSTSLHESVAEDRTSSTGSSGGLTKTQPDTRASTSSSHVPGGNWLMVERSGSTASAQAVAPAAGLLDTQDGGRSIADSAVDDEEATLQAAKAKREARSKEMLAAIQDDLDQVLNDPTEMLARLSIRSESGHGTRSSTRQKDQKHPVSSSEGKEASAAAHSDKPRSKNVPSIDTTNAVVAVDGVVTNLPASSEQFDASSLDVSDRRVVVLSDPVVERRQSVRSERRKAGFIKCLREEVVRMDELRTLAWAGVPDDIRPMVWMLLLGYLPANKAVRTQTLARKRAEYVSGVRNAFQRGSEELDQAIWHQIHIDVPRTNPGITLWQRDATQRALERILYVWAIRHPASGYVQGINDLATPFFEVFLSAYIATDPEQYDVALLPAEALEALEADTFWCLSKLLDGIQDNYIFAQPGIQRQVRRMSELVSRINPSLHGHFEEQSVEYMQFAFRWMNCLLMRELSVRNIVRLWDSYLAEGPDAFSEFHLFVCAAFLDRWSEELRKMDFQGIIMFLQSLPTQDWTAKETELLLADAFVKKSLFGGTAHLTN